MNNNSKKKVNNERTICGEFMDVHYDKTSKKLDICLIKGKTGAPLITICANNSGRSMTELLRLQLKEAIELKSIIEKLEIDYVEALVDGDFKE